MKRIIVIFIFLFSFNAIKSGEFKKLKCITISIPNVVKDYKSIIIEYIKQHEGLRLGKYKIGSIELIGWGFLVKHIDNVKLRSRMTSREADSLCYLYVERMSMELHARYPNLKPNELYALTHLYYRSGSGIINKVMINNKLDTIKLFNSTAYKKYAKFEKEMFYGKN